MLAPIEHNTVIFFDQVVELQSLGEMIFVFVFICQTKNRHYWSSNAI